MENERFTVWQTTSNNSTKVRGARLFILIYPIRSFSGVVVEVAVVGLNALKKLIAKQLLMCCHVPGSGTRRYIHISTELCERVAWVGRLKKRQRKRTLGLYKSNGHCIACVHPIRLEHLLRHLPALLTIRVRPELDGRTLDIVHRLNLLKIRK